MGDWRGWGMVAKGNGVIRRGHQIVSTVLTLHTTQWLLSMGQFCGTENTLGEVWYKKPQEKQTQWEAWPELYSLVMLGPAQNGHSSGNTGERDKRRGSPP